MEFARSLRPRARHAGRRAVLLGPAFVAAVAYVDPGNVATNTAAGAQYRYLLIWVVVAANLMACLVQYLSAKLGIVTGRSLPQILGDRLSRPVRRLYWAQAEIVAMATDLAEVLGGAIALGLLFGLPLLAGGLITALISTGVLLVADRRGQRRFEQLVTTMLLVLAVGFVAGLVVTPPDPGALAAGLVPRFDGSASVLLAAGVLGATVMPHAVYLHSALARDRHGSVEDPEDRRRLFSTTRIDVGLALLVAGAVNAALMILGAVALTGRPGDADSLEGVHTALGQVLGAPIALLFALALLLSGLASTSIGCYAGSVIMAGLLHTRVPLLVRRLVTLVPAAVLLASGVDPTWALVISQVVLSFGIPFALVPLVVLTARRDVMGADVARRPTTAVAAVIAMAVIALNVVLVGLTVVDG